MSRIFRELIGSQWEQGKFVCVGLDPDIEKMPSVARTSSARDTIIAFNRAVVDATHDLVCAYKPNSAFFEAYGTEGMDALHETIAYIRSVAPEVPVILDAKRGDIGNTNNGYAIAAFDWLGADALTVHPYLGADAVEPFLARADKGIFVLCRTSNGGSAEFQNLDVGGMPLYKKVAHNVAEGWNKHGNCGVVVGATYPEELKEVRAIVGEMPILIPGVGAQGGDTEAAVAAGKNASGRGIIINAARAVLYASKENDFADASRIKTQEFSGVIAQALV
jgi:orotidine-5'-phosphate decarboxylase